MCRYGAFCVARGHFSGEGKSHRVVRFRFVWDPRAFFARAEELKNVEAHRGEVIRARWTRWEGVINGESPIYDIPVPRYRNKKKPVRTYSISRYVLTVS